MHRRRLLAYLFCCFVPPVFHDCASAAPQPADDGAAKSTPVVPVWPHPPDQPRFIHEYAFRTYGDLEKKKEQTFLSMLAGEADRSEEYVFGKPAAVAARNGRIYVTDTGKNAVFAFDMPRRRIFPFGVRDDEGRLSNPVAVAVDDKRLVYVVDAAKRKVNIYDDLGLFLRSIGSPEDLVRPTGIAVDPVGERIYVVDRSTPEINQPRVVCYSHEGKLLFSFGRPGNAAGEFNIPLQAAIGPEGRLHILDSGNFRVQTFNLDGEYLSSFGQIGTGPGSLARPRGLAVDGDGVIYVSDATFGNIQMFNAQGQTLMFAGARARKNEDLAGRYALLAGVAVDETGRVYTVDQYFRKVEIMRRIPDEEGKKMINELNLPVSQLESAPTGADHDKQEHGRLAD